MAALIISLATAYLLAVYLFILLAQRRAKVTPSTPSGQK